MSKEINNKDLVEAHRSLTKNPDILGKN